MPSAESILFKVFIAVIIVGGIIIVALVVPRFLPSPATVTPSTTILDSGQTAVVAVTWKGGLEPYNVYLYSSTSGSCSTSSNRIGEESGQQLPQYMFTVSPTTTTRYCGRVTSDKGSSSISSAITVVVNPALGTPSLTLSSSVDDSGQTQMLDATVQMTGGSAPYTVTLFSGSSTSCSSDTTVVTGTSPSNPVSDLASQTATFAFQAPTATTYYCIGVTNSASTPAPAASSAVKFTVNPAVAVSVSPTSAKVDSEQSVALTATASKGTPPYAYQWYSAAGCAAPIAGQTGDTFDTGPLLASGSYSVQVSDNSTGSPASTACVSVPITVSAALTGTTVTIGPSALIDDGQEANLTVSWAKAGTAPYTVELTQSSGTTCPSGGASSVTSTTTSATTTTFTTTPSSTIHYCATVTDSADQPESAYASAAATVTVNPALTAGLTLSSTADDSGQHETVMASVTVAGGTPPYSITFRGGTSSNCLADGVIGTSSSPSSSYSVAAPATDSYYCAVATDSAPIPFTTTSSTIEFTVNAVPTVSISPQSPSVESTKPITLTADIAGGTSPYTYQWYTQNGCVSADKIAGQTSQSYTISSASATANYSVLAGDSSKGTPAYTSCASTTVKVTPLLVVSMSLTPIAKDTGQTASVTATVALAGGVLPYSVALHSGSSATCSADTTVVTLTSGTNPQTGSTGSSATFAFSSPSSSTYYCAVVTDSASTPDVVSTNVIEFIVSPTLGAATIKVTPYDVLDSGQAATPLTAVVTWTGGAPNFTVTLKSGSSSTCSSDPTVVTVTAGTNPETNIGDPSATFTFDSPQSTAYICAVVTDSGSPSLSSSTTTTLFTINPAVDVSALAVTPTVLDAGQEGTVTATATWTGGTSPYSVQLVAGDSSSCAADNTVVAVAPGSNPVTGLTTTTTSFTFSPPTLTSYYCVRVTDSSSIPVVQSSATTAFTINPDPSVTSFSLSPNADDAGETTTAKAIVSWSGGTAPYTVTVTEGISSTSCSADATDAAPAVADLIVTSDSVSFTSPASAAYYCVTVTDSSSTPMKVGAGPIVFTVNSDPKVTVSPPAPTIGAGEDSPTLTATASGGTPFTSGEAYAYQWYTGSSCGSVITGQTSDTYSPGVLASTSVFSVKATDNSTGSPSTDSSACAAVTVTAGLGPEGIATNSETGYAYVANSNNDTLSVIDGVANPPYVVISLPTGTHPWGVAIDPTTGCVSASVCWGTIYVTNYGSGTVTVINASTNSVITTIAIPLPDGCAAALPEGIAVNPTVKQAYVANSGCNTVSVIDTNTADDTYDTVIATIEVGAAPQSVAVGPSPYTVFVTDYGSDTVSVLTLTFNPNPSYGVTTETVGSNPWGVAVDQSTNLVYVTNSGSGTLSVLNGTTFATVATVNLGSGTSPEGVSIDPTTAVAYIADSADSSVIEVNLSTNALISSASPAIPVPVEANPLGISVLLNPSNPTYPSLAYVTDAGSNVVSVINLATNEVIATIVVP